MLTSCANIWVFDNVAANYRIQTLECSVEVEADWTLFFF